VGDHETLHNTGNRRRYLRYCHHGPGNNRRPVTAAEEQSYTIPWETIIDNRTPQKFALKITLETKAA